MNQIFSSPYSLATNLANQTDIIDKVESWTLEFERYVDVYDLMDLSQPHNKSVFNQVLTQFLFSPKGGAFRQQFKFQNDVICGEPVSDMLLSQITFQHRILSGPEEQIPAMNRVKEIIKSANVTDGKVFPLSQGYAAWETDEVSQ